MDDDASTEATYRSTLSSLTQRVLPPSISLLPAQLLALASALLRPSLASPLPWRHGERDTDFWDARHPAAKAWDEGQGGMVEGEKLEVGRGEVEGVREARRAYLVKVKEADGEEKEGWMGGLEVWRSLHRLKGDYLLPRSSRRFSSPSLSSYLEGQAKSRLVALAGPSPAKLFPKPDERFKEMDGVGDVEEAMRRYASRDVKLPLSEEEVAFVKRERAEFKRVREDQGEELESVEEKVVEAFPHPPSPRLGSPPPFARPSALSLTVPSFDAFVGGVGLTSSMSDLPPSPSPGGTAAGGGKAGVGMEEWNGAGASSALYSSSPSPQPPSGSNTDREVWSSSAPTSIAPGAGADGYLLEKPLFPRPSKEDDGTGAIKVPVLTTADDEEIDQLDSDSDADADLERLSERAPQLEQGGVETGKGLFASDDTVGDAVGEEERRMRLRIPHLPSAPSLLPPAPSIPPLSAFSFTTSNAPPTTYSLTPLPGLRSLSISLSWDICHSASAGAVPHDDRSVREFVDEEDEGEEGVVRGLKEGARAVRRRLEEGRTSWEHEEAEEGKEEGWPKAEEGGEEEVDLTARMALEPLDSQDSDEEAAEVAEAREVKVGVAAGEDEDEEAVPARSSPSPYGAVQPLSPRPTEEASAFLDHHNPPVPPTSSSDFGFVFPHPSSPAFAASLPPAQPPSPRRSSPLDTSQTSPTAHAAPPSALDSLVLDRPSPLSETEKAIPPPGEDSPRWSNGAALDCFLLARGRGEAVSTKRRAPGEQEREAAAKKPSLSKPGPARSPHSSPPPGSIPFTIPPFLASGGDTSRAVERQRSGPLRAVASSALLQMRGHFVALQQQGFDLVHRSSFASSSSTEEAPELHLTVAPATGVLFVKLVSLLGGGAVSPANKDDPAVFERERSKPPRPDPLLTTLSRLTRTTHDRLLVLLEEPTVRIGGVKLYAYTPPVLSALRDLAGGLSQLDQERGGGTSVEVALSKGEGHSAELVRAWCGCLEAEERRARGRGDGGLPALDVWGERAWLTDDPSEDELILLHLATGDNALDPLSAAAVIGTCSLNDLSGMDEDDRVAVLGGLLGEERANRLSSLFSASSSTTLTHIGRNSYSPSSGDDASLFVPLSAIGGSGSSDGAFQEQFEAAFDFERYDAEAGLMRV
ncbi:hypothetical protein JCM6882_006905 [Rhodosporidiobolus microsporus]